MNQQIGDIKRLRKQADLTQQQLAKLAGVSQSIIAKIERGAIDPSFSIVTQIFAALESAKQTEAVPITQIMSKTVASIAPDTKLPQAVAILKKKGVSQLPIIEGQSVIGLISESSLIDALLQNQHAKLVKDIMIDPPPVVPHTTSLQLVSQLLKEHDIVLITKKGAISGIISRTDLLDMYF
ncbi:MAG: putative transcriptional regulator [Candidatus Woesearchaeota archaeon]|jgi:predicted transcriptional regulator